MLDEVALTLETSVDYMEFNVGEFILLSLKFFLLFLTILLGMWALDSLDGLWLIIPCIFLTGLIWLFIALQLEVMIEDFRSFWGYCSEERRRERWSESDVCTDVPGSRMCQAGCYEDLETWARCLYEAGELPASELPFCVRSEHLGNGQDVNV